MWEMAQNVTHCKEQLQANNKEHLVQQLITHIPHLYYQGIPESIVVDKCRSWTHEPNLNLARICIHPNTKVIVLERPVVEIVNSFARLYQNNGIYGENLESKLVELLEPKTEPLMRSIQGVQWARKQKDPNTFLFVQYDELVSTPNETIERIYEFCGWEPFEHNFNQIQMKYPENDDAYGLIGYHQVRSKILKQYDNPILSDKILTKAKKIDELMAIQYNVNLP